MMLSDMLLWQPREADSTDSVWTIKNIDKASIKGTKVKVSFQHRESLGGSIDFAYNDARNKTTKTVLIYRPKYILATSCQWSWGRISTGVSCRYSSKVFSNEENTRHLPSIWTFDANFGYTILSIGTGSQGVRLIYDVINAFDKLASTNEGYPLPGREHRLSLKIGF
jgi:outer membrane cobalamin receptor